LNDSFLVFSSHFKRETLPEKQTGVREPDPENNMGSSTWIWPTRGRKIRNDSAGSGYFNAPRASGRGHQGVDIVAAVGEPVLATRSGTIIDPAWEGSYGRVVDVKHTGGLMSRYAHLNSFTFSHGTYVRQGDRIGTAGRTGNASGYGVTPHLHFEIRNGSRLQNPLSLLPY
jgi:murein DD-endopeptidase MepM/ murein hydrolase activator NlpD